MRYFILILLLFFPGSVFAKNAPSLQVSDVKKGILIKDIRIEGFVLGDKAQFVELFKPYRNKHLTTADMDEILQKLQIIYEREGYLELVTITYKVIKYRLVFTVLMTS